MHSLRPDFNIILYDLVQSTFDESKPFVLQLWFLLLSSSSVKISIKQSQRDY